MEDKQINAADDWARDLMQDKRATKRSRRITFTLTDLVLAFDAGVTWERERGLQAIRKCTQALEQDARRPPQREDGRKHTQEKQYGSESSSPIRR